MSDQLLEKEPSVLPEQVISPPEQPNVVINNIAASPNRFKRRAIAILAGVGMIATAYLYNKCDSISEVETRAGVESATVTKIKPVVWDGRAFTRVELRSYAGIKTEILGRTIDEIEAETEGVAEILTYVEGSERDITKDRLGNFKVTVPAKNIGFLTRWKEDETRTSIKENRLTKVSDGTGKLLSALGIKNPNNTIEDAKKELSAYSRIYGANFAQKECAEDAWDYVKLAIIDSYRLEAAAQDRTVKVIFKGDAPMFIDAYEFLGPEYDIDKFRRAQKAKEEGLIDFGVRGKVRCEVAEGARQPLGR